MKLGIDATSNDGRSGVRLESHIDMESIGEALADLGLGVPPITIGRSTVERPPSPTEALVDLKVEVPHPSPAQTDRTNEALRILLNSSTPSLQPFRQTNLNTGKVRFPGMNIKA